MAVEGIIPRGIRVWLLVLLVEGFAGAESEKVNIGIARTGEEGNNEIFIEAIQAADGFRYRIPKAHQWTTSDFLVL